MLPSQFKRLINAVRSLLDPLRTESRTIQEAIKKQNDAIGVGGESAKQNQAEAAKIVARAINDASDATSSYEKPQRDKEYRLQVVLVILTFLAALGAISAAVGSWFALPVVKKSADAAACAANIATEQFKLMRQQWELTQGARVNVIARMDFPPQDGSSRVYLNFFNDGHDPAGDFMATVRISQLTVVRENIVSIFQPSPTTIAAPYALTPFQDRTEPYQFDTHHFEKQLIFSKQKGMVSRLKDADDLIEIRGEYTYNNGFESATIPLCLRFVTFFAPAIPQTSGPSVLNQDFVECRNFDTLRDQMLSAKKDAEKQK